MAGVEWLWLVFSLTTHLQNMKILCLPVTASHTSINIHIMSTEKKNLDFESIFYNKNLNFHCHPSCLLLEGVLATRRVETHLVKRDKVTELVRCVEGKAGGYWTTGGSYVNTFTIYTHINSSSLLLLCVALTICNCNYQMWLISINVRLLCCSMWQSPCIY